MIVETAIIECPCCGHENIYDVDEEEILCEDCNETIFCLGLSAESNPESPNIG